MVEARSESLVAGDKPLGCNRLVNRIGEPCCRSRTKALEGEEEDGGHIEVGHIEADHIAVGHTGVDRTEAGRAEVGRAEIDRIGAGHRGPRSSERNLVE